MKLFFVLTTLLITHQQPPTKILMLIANGFDEISFSTSLNLLQKSGLSVEVVKVFNKEENLTDIRVQSNYGGSYKPEFRFERVVEKMKEYIMVIVPDGKLHCQTIVENQDVVEYLKKHKEKNYWVAGIGASPAIVFAKGGIIQNEQLTCNNLEEFTQYLKDQSKIQEKVVISNRIISGQNTGVVFEWTLSIIEKLQDTDTAKEIADNIIFQYWEQEQQLQQQEQQQENQEESSLNEEL